MREPTQEERVRVLWQLLHVEHPKHACQHYHLRANARLAACFECADGSTPVKSEQRASAVPGLRDLDLSELDISPEQAARFDLLAIKQDTIAREDASWLDTEQRS